MNTAQLTRLVAEPRPVVRRWPSRFDMAFGIVVATIALSEFYFRPNVTVISLSAVLVGATMLAFRRVAPLVAISVALVTSTAVGKIQVTDDLSVIGMASNYFLLLLPCNLFRWGSGKEAVAGITLVTLTYGFNFIADRWSASAVALDAVVLGLSFATGLVLRLRESGRIQRIQNVKSLERERIARDLHDTVAHHVSGIAVRAQAGLALGTHDSAAALEALKVIAIEASKTLDEMRTMVGTLRGQAAADYQPHTGLEALASLADNSASPAVHIETIGSVEGVADAVVGAVNRIAQEAITNARRHGRGTTRIDVRLELSGDAIHLDVTNDGRTAPPSSRHHGYGLIGMKERAELLGGNLRAEPQQEGGWRVAAVLPKKGSVQ